MSSLQIAFLKTRCLCLSNEQVADALHVLLLVVDLRAAGQNGTVTAMKVLRYQSQLHCHDEHMATAFSKHLSMKYLIIMRIISKHQGDALRDKPVHSMKSLNGVLTIVLQLKERMLCQQNHHSPQEAVES